MEECGYKWYVHWQIRVCNDRHSKTSFEKSCFSAWASTLNMGLINKGWYGMFVACGIWCLADVLSISPSSEQTAAW